MKSVHIITPVKDSITTTRQTIDAIVSSQTNRTLDYTIFNDNSTIENSEILSSIAAEHNIKLINISDITDHPSPNYLLILQMAQKRAVEEDAHLVIIESDVVVKPNTIQELAEMADRMPNCGMLGSVTVNAQGEVNYPYLYAKNIGHVMLPTRKRISFCCTLITNAFLNSYDFAWLNPEKSWFDVHISHKALELGFSNYIMGHLPVLHQPHSSRPWKNLKYSNPIKYYWLKATKGLDKI